MFDSIFLSMKFLCRIDSQALGKCGKRIFFYSGENLCNSFTYLQICTKIYINRLMLDTNDVFSSFTFILCLSHTHTRIHKLMNTLYHTQTHTHTHTHTHMCTHTHVHTHTHTHTHTCTHTHTFAITYIHILTDLEALRGFSNFVLAFECTQSGE